jgi:hypothetical protein
MVPSSLSGRGLDNPRILASTRSLDYGISSISSISEKVSILCLCPFST